MGHYIFIARNDNRPDTGLNTSFVVDKVFFGTLLEYHSWNYEFVLHADAVSHML